jgi:hypothetical protein
LIIKGFVFIIDVWAWISFHSSDILFLSSLHCGSDVIQIGNCWNLQFSNCILVIVLLKVVLCILPSLCSQFLKLHPLCPIGVGALLD